MPNLSYTYKQFYFKQFSLTYVNNFNVKNISFKKKKQFSVITLFSPILAIDRNLSVATLPGKSGVIEMK